MIHKDQLRREIKLEKIPNRIVSLVPSQTELLVDLGLEDQIIGVTKFCVHPEYIKTSKEIVGGTKKVSFDKIKALSPDIILCNKEENTKGIVEALEKDFKVHVSNISTIDEALEMIGQYGKLFKKEKQAHDLISKTKIEISGFMDFIKDKPEKKVAYFIWKDPWMTIGNDTFIHYLLELTGFVNVFGGQKRYPETSLRELSKMRDLQYVFLSSEPFPFKAKHIQEVEEYCPFARVILVDGEFFSWYGSRLVKSFSYFKSLHQDLRS